SDWLAGLIITITIVILSGSASLQSIERNAYDWGMQSTERFPSDKIAVIAIDDQSIGNLGRWPWPRDLHAEMIQKLGDSGAKVIGQTVFFLEPQVDPGRAYIQELINFISRSSLVEIPAEIEILGSMLEQDSQISDIVKPTKEFLAQSALNNSAIKDLETLQQGLISAEDSLNTDLKLAQSTKSATNVILAMPFIIGTPKGKPDSELPKYVLNNSLNTIHDRVSAQANGLFPFTTIDAIPPIEVIGNEASAIGHLNAVPDVDGGIRTEPLVLQNFGRFYPSLSLQIAAKSLNLSVDDIKVNLAESIEMGGLIIKTDPLLQMHSFFYSDIEGFSPFEVDSFYDVYSGKIPLAKYKNKIVLIGATATGVGSSQVTPVDPAMAPVLTLAHAVSSILQEDFFVEPEWAIYARIALFLIVALYLMFLMPRVKAGIAALITVVLFITILTTHFILMTNMTLWVQLMGPAILLIVGHLLITTKRFLVTERGKLRSDAESSESNRMLGLAFQGQGQLDMAFEKFRKCPLNDDVMEPLYNLALDFERKRQFNKATGIYEYMSKHDDSFRDIKKRMNRSQAMEDTVMIGGSAGSNSSMLLDDGSMEKPMLGRYEIEKELGKGAMGVVYLGKDPKISRVVAIKTMALAQEFEDDELVEVKERFFREAETAGRLSHPNIVTIYDAGEEHDLAYIAMEFLKGKDLAVYTKPTNLLDRDLVVSIVIRSAEGLAFAHNLNVVHRDIKPANLMYEPESDTLKITDFGIARITDSSKTKTGMVLGTPSYMSPEQLAGKKVDGRSDLFSLGVMLYQLLSGKLPFTADSMASLMFKITNEEAPVISTVNPDISPELEAIVTKSLAKNADERYQTGNDFAAALKAYLAKQ
ncbi:MAG: CHASE2 domain-containing protein, partial [Gammaproteobacteria bacterium]|nr:CHASE2 domain-containing protein [Gammaproteobacteria bacterium]